MRLVLALGGNALLERGEAPGVEIQEKHVAVAVAAMAPLADHHDLVVTHGNGPQVGFILRRSEIGSAEVPVVPMDYATADTQGAIGSMFQRALAFEFVRLGLNLGSVTLVTHVVVGAEDPAFTRPDKPIGVFYPEARARDLGRRLGWMVAEDSGRGWRRVVPSPWPRQILEIDDIAHLAGRNRIVVACGGGGIPVLVGADGRLTGVEAVVDKDRTSALLARLLGADALLLCTGVDAVCTGWGTPAQRRLDRISSAEAAALLAAGELGAGSMGPKVEAALDFVAGSGPGRRAVIGRLERLSALAEGAEGTAIVEERG